MDKTRPDLAAQKTCSATQKKLSFGVRHHKNREKNFDFRKKMSSATFSSVVCWVIRLRFRIAPRTSVS